MPSRDPVRMLKCDDKNRSILLPDELYNETEKDDYNSGYKYIRFSGTNGQVNKTQEVKTGYTEQADKLLTARSIGLSGVFCIPQLFDGTEDIVIPITEIPTSLFKGVISMENLPAGAIERLYPVDTDEERFQLTINEVQNGDIVKVGDTGLMYLVKDDTKLDSEEGYEVYKAGWAAAVPWTGVTEKPISQDVNDDDPTHIPSSKVVKDLYDYTKDEIERFESEMDEKFQQLTDDTDTRLTNFENEMNEKFQQLTDDTNTAIENLTTSTNTTIQNFQNEMNEKFDQLTEDTDTRLTEFEDEMNEKFRELTENTDTRITDFENDINEKFQQLVDETNTAIENLVENTKVNYAKDADTAAELKNPRKIDGVEFSGLNDITHYGVCFSEASDDNKIVSLDNFFLVEGARIAVRFENVSTATAPTLNVNDTGAKNIVKYGTTPIDPNTWSAGAVVEFVYDGISWCMTSSSGAVYQAGTVAPTNTSILWIDTTPTTGGLKFYNGSVWQHVPVAYT